MKTHLFTVIFLLATSLFAEQEIADGISYMIEPLTGFVIVHVQPGHSVHVAQSGADGRIIQVINEKSGLYISNADGKGSRNYHLRLSSDASAETSVSENTNKGYSIIFDIDGNGEPDKKIVSNTAEGTTVHYRATNEWIIVSEDEKSTEPAH